MKAVDYRVIGHEIVPVLIPVKEDRNAKGCFAKGHDSWNKGMKGVFFGSVETQYKKGNQPHNTKHDRCISERHHRRDGITFKYIRLASSKWQLLNRYVWEQHHGPIPEKHVIRHRDGNSLNCEIDNLECISMAEHCRRNANYRKKSETMKKLWRSERLREENGLTRKTKLRVK